MERSYPLALGAGIASVAMLGLLLYSRSSPIASGPRHSEGPERPRVTSAGAAPSDPGWAARQTRNALTGHRPGPGEAERSGTRGVAGRSSMAPGSDTAQGASRPSIRTTQTERPVASGAMARDPAIVANAVRDGAVRPTEGLRAEARTSQGAGATGPQFAPEAQTDQPRSDGAEEEAVNGGGEDLLLSVPLNGHARTEGLIQPTLEQDLTAAATGEGMDFPEHSILQFPDASMFIRGDGGTIALDIEPHWTVAEEGVRNNAFVEVKTEDMWQGRMQLMRNGSYLRFFWFDDDGAEIGVGVSINEWQAGQRHSVVATWGDALMSLYIDGRLAGQTTYSGQLSIPPGMPMFLGSNPNNHVPGAAATLANFQAYGRPLTADEIAAR